MRELFVVIPASNRQDMISELLTSIMQPASNVILIDNGSDPPLRQDFNDRAFVVHNYPTELNIQRWWDLGWEIAESLAWDKDNYAVAFLNSDAMISKRDIETLAEEIDRSNSSVTFFDHCKVLHPTKRQTRSEPGPGPWSQRMSGYCFVVRGELPIRFDEEFQWWYGDDDFEWRARPLFSGVTMVGGTWADNRDENSGFREHAHLLGQVELDKQRFLSKWGVEPLV